MNSKILAIHGGHDCSVTLVDKNGQMRIFELERFTKIKVDGFRNNKLETKKFLEYTKTQLKEIPKYILYSYLEDDDIDLIKELFSDSKFIKMGHHTSHCIGAYQQSGFKDALVISMDGGGVDFDHYGISKNIEGNTIYYCIMKIVDNKRKVIFHNNLPNSIDFAPGVYCGPTIFISEISSPNQENSKIFELKKIFDDKQFGNFKDHIWILKNDFMINAGKLMGLSAYGKVCKDLIPPLREYSYKNNNHGIYTLEKFKTLFEQLGLYLKDLGIKSLKGSQSFDLAATNQYVFEELCFEMIRPYIDSCNLDVVLSGGCALNVLFNQKLFLYLKEKNRKLFVSPTPGDGGLSYGHVCSIDKNMKDVLSVYSGLDILDRNKIPEYYDRYNKVGKVFKLS